MKSSRPAIVVVSVLFVFIAVFRAPTPAASPSDWQSTAQRQIAEHRVTGHDERRHVT